MRLRDDLWEPICSQTFARSQQSLTPWIRDIRTMIKLERGGAAMVVIREPIWRNRTQQLGGSQ